MPQMVHVYDMEVASLEDAVPRRNLDKRARGYGAALTKHIKEGLLRGEYDRCSSAVSINFFIRHGLITVDDEPDYAEIETRLHRRLPFPVAPRLV